MVASLLGIYFAFLMAIGAASAIVALAVPEEQKDRRTAAVSILKLVLGTGTGLTAVASVAIQLYNAGLW